MASFDHLPNEIILGILDMVLPEDLENFAQTSKRVFLLAETFLEHHRQLIRLHSTTFKGNQPRRDDTFWSAPIPSLLMTIRNEPRIAHYIRDVKLENSGTIRRNGFYYNDRELCAKQRDLVNALIAQSTVPNIQFLDRPKEFLCFNSNEFYEEFLVALFLLLLPNLNNLSLPWHPAHNYFRNMIQQSALEGNNWLANLTTVRVKGGFVPKAPGIRDLSLFSSLPALKSLTALNAFDNSTNIDNFLPSSDSHTKNLELNNSYFSRLTVYWYLQSFQSLQTFTLASDDYQDNCIRSQFDPKMIRAALVVHARTTLQSLTITTNGPLDLHTFMGSLQPFEALEKVRTQWTALFPKDSCLETWPSRILPASIRKLQLDDNADYNGSESYRALCQGLQRAKMTTCLHFDLVEIGEGIWNEVFWDEVHVAEYLGDLHGFCSEIGMSVTFQKTAQTSEWQRGSNVMSLTFTEKTQTIGSSYSVYVDDDTRL